jgi:hypothetical protein
MQLRERGGGNNILMVGVHLPSKKQRLKRMEALERLLVFTHEQVDKHDADGFVITGDFNMKAQDLAAALLEAKDKVEVGDLGLRLAFGAEDPPTAASGVIDNVMYGGVLEDAVLTKQVSQRPKAVGGEQGAGTGRGKGGYGREGTRDEGVRGGEGGDTG